MTAYDDAIAALYQTSVENFVAERKRLVGELRSAGDRDGAAALAKRARPTLSAWAVNQLYWRARESFDAMLATAARLRGGDVSATAAHRDAIARLRTRASEILVQGGHVASEAVLRRVASTLAALAASNGFDRDPPGALASDRDPPGFEAIGAFAPAAPQPSRIDDVAVRNDEVERTRLAAERERLEAALRTARGELATRERRIAALREELVAAEDASAAARRIVTDLEEKLGEK